MSTNISLITKHEFYITHESHWQDIRKDAIQFKYYKKIMERNDIFLWKHVCLKLLEFSPSCNAITSFLFSLREKSSLLIFNKSLKRHIFPYTCLSKTLEKSVMPSLLPHFFWGRSHDSLFFGTVVSPGNDIFSQKHVCLKLLKVSLPCFYFSIFYKCDESWQRIYLFDIYAIQTCKFIHFFHCVLYIFFHALYRPTVLTNSL